MRPYFMLRHSCQASPDFNSGINRILLHKAERRFKRCDLIEAVLMCW